MNQILQCPKCHGAMRSRNRAGVQIEQCGDCRGIFLDYGELEHLTQLESQWGQPPQAAPPPPPPPSYGGHGGGHGYQPGWGTPGHHQGHYRKRGFGSMLFSS